MKKYDILIPCAKKDENTLDICIKSCKKRIKNDISKIFIVSNIKNDKIKQIVQDNDCIFVDEDKVLGFSVEDLKQIKPDWNRWGWMFQQFIKLCGTVTEQEDFIVVDSEVVFIKDISFEDENGNPIFYWNNHSHLSSFFDILPKITSLKKFNEVSFINDFMVFNKDVLSEIREEIEKKTETNWIDGILRNIEFNDFPFSEFELYGNMYNKPYTLRKIRYQTCGRIYEDLSLMEKDWSKWDVIVMHSWLRK